MGKQTVLLIDLATFPKGSISLSLAAVASTFQEEYHLVIIDLNIQEDKVVFNLIQTNEQIAFVGFKVSAQNYSQAIDITTKIKHKNPTLPIVWGGELPTLVPEECLKYATAIVQGLFETVYEEFNQDLQQKSLKPIYKGHNKSEVSTLLPPRLDLLHPDGYPSFMGLPLETSRGCTESCAFCMVHQMQPKNYFNKTAHQLEEELEFYKNKFVNIIDYNFGVNEEHVVNTARLLKKASVSGWMAEMCIEQLDNDKLLKEMSESNCRIIYCGLETIEDVGLAGVHKMNTNKIANYERIIRKVQSHGIQIASGFILGINGMTKDTFEKSFLFFQRMGIIYVKLTFLTYNPGTKVAANMKKKGDFTTEDITHYDGNHLSYIPYGVNKEIVINGTYFFIKKFYSISNIIRRSFYTTMGWNARLRFILFSYLYRKPYMEWLQYDTLNDNAHFQQLLNTKYKKTNSEKIADRLLSYLRSKS